MVAATAPEPAAASSNRRAEAADNARGFSHKTFLPAASAASTTSSCSAFGKATLTIATRSSAITARQSVAVSPKP